MKELQPVNHQVVLDITESNQEQRTSSGIYIPDENQILLLVDEMNRLIIGK